MQNANDEHIAASLSTVWGTSIPSDTQLPQIKHRLALLRQLSLFSNRQDTGQRITTAESEPSPSASGPKILDVGCGQGDTTASLLALLEQSGRLGKGGHVTAIDPGSPDYGSPLTLAQAQTLVTKNFGSENVTFIQSDAVSFANLLNVNAKEKPFEVVILAKSLWYFPSVEAVLETLKAAATVADRVFIAEYALHASSTDADAHVYTARAQARLYAAGVAAASNPNGGNVAEVKHVTDNFLRTSNLRIAPTPDEFKKQAEYAGLYLANESVIECAADLQDGRWDVGSLLSGSGRPFLEKVELVEKACGKRSEETRAELQRVKEAVMKLATDDGDEATKIKQGLKKVKTMDVWCGEFVVRQELGDGT